MKKKILFLYLKTWWGHVSTAKAVTKYLHDHHHDEVEVVLEDGLEDSYPFIKEIVEKWYATLQDKWKYIYSFLYACNKNRLLAKTTQFLMKQCTEKYIQEAILRHQPTEIVIFHFFLVQPVVEILSLMDKKIPVTTVVTDPFTPPRLWFLEKKMNYVVYSEQARDHAIDWWISPKNIRQFPTIVDEKYSKKISAQEVLVKKKQYHMNPNLKTTLLLGWGDGMPNGEKIVEDLLALPGEREIVVVCGKNNLLYEEINYIKKTHPEKHIHVYGFIDFVYDMISVADVIITKWWPATLMEILLLGKIPVINSYLWWQEKGNVKFVVNNGIWIYEKNREEMIKNVQKILNWEQKEYLDRLNKLALRNGVAEFSEWLLRK